MSMRERIASLIAGLAEETGEVNAIIRRHLWRDKRNIRPELLEELGDVLFSSQRLPTRLDSRSKRSSKATLRSFE